jgi:hypothetical protein
MTRWLAENRAAALIAGGLVLVAVALVALSLRREPPITYAPTAPAPREVGDSLVGPVRVTVDASDPDRWVYFDFSRGSVVVDPPPTGWDLAFRRFNIMVNGGAGFPGRGGARALAAAALDSVGSVPTTGYRVVDAAGDSMNPAMDHWYDYGFTSHLLTPRPTVFAVRTADGRYVALRLLSYYCRGASPGCTTFEYVYQGDGSTRFD